ncbi:hypothetical protein AN958_09080 [Leucoagaricus sp. SymC.cos]|nr:hypothetical protein AN958_09080 [Leucoagaricus sp. SymC.cos]
MYWMHILISLLSTLFTPIRGLVLKLAAPPDILLNDIKNGRPACHFTVPPSEDGRREVIKRFITTFLNGIDYTLARSNEERRKALCKALLLGFSEHRHNVWFEDMCRQSAAMAELAYHEHPFEEQLQIASFTWFMLYIDDLCSKFPGSLQRFQHSILSNKDSDHGVLTHFRAHLLDMYNFWDTAAANGIITAAMEFVNGCALEEMPELRNMTLSVSARSWPYFLRMKTGVAQAYAFMIFPRHSNPDISGFIQVIGDISLFIDLTNDILSFYKEDLAGETKNYVHNRACMNRQPVLDVLNNILYEALAAQARVTATLHNTESVKQWSTFIKGYGFSPNTKTLPNE